MPLQVIPAICNNPIFPLGHHRNPCMLRPHENKGYLRIGAYRAEPKIANPKALTKTLHSFIHYKSLSHQKIDMGYRTTISHVLCERKRSHDRSTSILSDWGCFTRNSFQASFRHMWSCSTFPCLQFSTSSPLTYNSLQIYNDSSNFSRPIARAVKYEIVTSLQAFNISGFFIPSYDSIVIATKSTTHAKHNSFCFPT